MKIKIVSGIMLMLLFMGMLTLACKIQLAKADPTTIYVDDDNTTGPWDGTLEHPYQNITSALDHASDNDTIYVYNGTYYGWVWVTKTVSLIGENKETTIIDANGTGTVISVGANEVVVEEFTIRGGVHYGVSTSHHYIIIRNNKIINNDYGIYFDSSSSYNIASGNSITNNRVGIVVVESSYNSILGNNITNNSLCGINLGYSSNNRIYHNNIIDNTAQVILVGCGANVWDDGYPSGGNYWSNYAGVDLYSGPNQDQPGSDGIRDTPYVMDANNRDRYPLMNPWFPVPPIANFSYSPEFPLVGETVTFNASASYDPDGYITSYKWDFGDGNITTVTTPIITHAYMINDTCTTNLTVTNIYGLSHSTVKSVTVIADSIPPTTIHDYDGLWHTTDFTINLTATDTIPGSGVEETYYTVNDGPTQNVSTHGQPLITTESANNTLEYWSVDKAENEELPHKTLTGIKLDKTPPTIGIPSRIPEGDVQPNQIVKVFVNVTDSTSGVESVRLVYFINDSTIGIEFPMAFNSTTGLYFTSFGIPGQQANTLVRYAITAYDNAGNNATLDGTELYCTYQVIPEFSSSLILPLFMIITLPAVIVYRRRKHSM